MAGKTKSAAKPMWGSNPLRQYLCGLFGPLNEAEAAAYSTVLCIQGQVQSEAGMDSASVQYWGRILVGLFAAGDAKFFEDAAKAMRVPNQFAPAEPWRLWLVKTYLLPSWFTGQEQRKPESIERILQEIADRFEVHLDDRELRKELRRLGIPFARAKPGRKPSK